MGGTHNPEPVNGEPDLEDPEEKEAFAEFLRSRKAATRHDDGAAA